MRHAARPRRPAQLQLQSPLVRLTSAVLLLMLSLTLLASCISSGEPGPATATAPATAGPSTPAPAPEASPTPAAATPAAFRSPRADLGRIVWATSVDPQTKEPTTPVRIFTEDAEALYAALPIIRIEAGTVLIAEWTYNDTPVEPLTSRVTALEPYANAWVEFHLSRSPHEPWPTGVYQITILVGDAEALTAEVAVRR